MIKEPYTCLGNRNTLERYQNYAIQYRDELMRIISVAEDNMFSKDDFSDYKCPICGADLLIKRDKWANG